MQVRDPPVATAHSRRSGAHRWLLSLRWGEVAQVSSLPKHTPVVHKIQWWWLGRGFLGLRGSIPINHRFLSGVLGRENARVYANLDRPSIPDRSVCTKPHPNI